MSRDAERPEDERIDARPDERIEHGPVVLRRYQLDDLDAIVQAVTESAGHLRPWLPWAVDYTRESAEEFLASSIRGWDEGLVFNYAITTAGTLTQFWNAAET